MHRRQDRLKKRGGARGGRAEKGEKTGEGGGLEEVWEDRVRKKCCRECGGGKGAGALKEEEEEGKVLFLFSIKLSYSLVYSGRVCLRVGGGGVVL